MTTNDEPLSTYRPAYVAGLERRVLEQREAIERALEALEAVEWVVNAQDLLVCAWCDGEKQPQKPEREWYDEDWQHEMELEYWHEMGHRADCPREAVLAELRRVAGLQNG